MAVKSFISFMDKPILKDLRDSELIGIK